MSAMLSLLSWFLLVMAAGGGLHTNSASAEVTIASNSAAVGAYWHTMLPNTLMPSAILELLAPPACIIDHIGRRNTNNVQTTGKMKEAKYVEESLLIARKMGLHSTNEANTHREKIQMGVLWWIPSTINNIQKSILLWVQNRFFLWSPPTINDVQESNCILGTSTTNDVQKGNGSLGSSTTNDTQKNNGSLVSSTTNDVQNSNGNYHWRSSTTNDTQKNNGSLGSSTTNDVQNGNGNYHWRSSTTNDTQKNNGSFGSSTTNDVQNGNGNYHWRSSTTNDTHKNNGSLGSSTTNDVQNSNGNYHWRSSTTNDTQKNNGSFGSSTTNDVQKSNGESHIGEDNHQHGTMSNWVFIEEALKLGSTIPCYVQPSHTSGAPLLRRDVADTIPMSTRNFTDIMTMFAPVSNNMAADMRSTLDLCEHPQLVKGETKACATSVESMVEFAASVLGVSTYNLRAFSSPDVPTEGVMTGRRYKVAAATRVTAARDTVTCHGMRFPFAMFLCHAVNPTRVYSVTLEGDDVGADGAGERMEVLAVCHLDTSDFDPDKMPLHVKPGDAPLCHFVSRDSILWAPAAAASGHAAA